MPGRRWNDSECAGRDGSLSLYVGASLVTDLGYLADLKRLKRLGLRDSHVTDLGPLRNLDALEEIILRGSLAPTAGW